MPRARWREECRFDVWFPVAAPSEAFLRRWQKRLRTAGPAEIRAFRAGYERELLGRAESRQAVELLAALARRMPLSIGCFCEDESRCHRAHLRVLIERVAGESEP